MLSPFSVPNVPLGLRKGRHLSQKKKEKKEKRKKRKARHEGTFSVWTKGRHEGTFSVWTAAYYLISMWNFGS